MIVLEEDGGDRRLPIWTGEREGTVLAFALGKVELFRPLSDHFMYDAPRAVASRVLEVRIDPLAAKTFYVMAVFEAPSGPVEVDVRPIDALKLGHPRRGRVIP